MYISIVSRALPTVVGNLQLLGILISPTVLSELLQIKSLLYKQCDQMAR